MILQEIEINDLYGSMNLKMRFNSDITMLVGINGCGKTSILTVIDWLLRPNLKKLSIAKYTKLLLKFSYEGRDYALKASKTKTRMTLSIMGSEVALKPITVNLVHVNAENIEAQEETYGHLGLEKHEIPFWNLLKSFPKPITITLDRTITAEADNFIYEEMDFSPAKRMARPKSPISHVQEVTTEKYSEFRKKSIQNDVELKARLAMSALQAPDQIFRGGTARAMTKGEITKLQGKVIAYLRESIKTEDVTLQVNTFFNALSQLEEQYKAGANKSSLFTHFMLSQYKQAESLAKAFNDFETKNAAAFKDLKKYLDTINIFFEDSSKKLFFDPSTGRLAFTMNDAKGATVGASGEKKNISHLSSGENQILILFTFLAFVAKSGSVFIVDEPELSLHPKWQHQFMEAFLQLCPSNTQLLLATHSPEIVGRHKEKCATPQGAGK